MIEFRPIRKISIVCQLGAETYEVGRSVGGVKVASISTVPVYYSGDPYDTHCGYDKDGNALFSVSNNAPCVIEYL